ncbi:MAG: hypothetical protein AAGJ87_13865 [Pseudomonadota bacterium]
MKREEGGALAGDRTVSSRNEPAPWSISARIGEIRGWGWATQSPATASSVDALAIAQTEFAGTLNQLRSVENRLADFEDELERLGAPRTPGSGVPNWRKED